MATYHQPRAGEFRYGFFNCCDSCSDCLLAYLCPNCYAFCAAQEAEEGLCTALCNCIFYPFCLCCLRNSIREKRGIDGGCCVDLMAACFCPCCTIIQLKREFSD